MIQLGTSPSGGNPECSSPHSDNYEDQATRLNHTPREVVSWKAEGDRREPAILLQEREGTCHKRCACHPVPADTRTKVACLNLTPHEAIPKQLLKRKDRNARHLTPELTTIKTMLMVIWLEQEFETI